jgi:hypothetical protein
MVISNKLNRSEHPRCILNNIPINEVEEHRHLGVTLSYNLSWTSHISNIYIAANQRLGMLKPVQFRVDRRSLERLYISCILPMLEYADVVWAGAFEKDLNKLDQVHHCAARLVSGATQRCSSGRLMEEVGWDSLLNRRRAHRLTLFHKIVNGKSPPYLQAVCLPKEDAVQHIVCVLLKILYQ